MENLGIYETYMYFAQIPGIGKISVVGTPSNLGLILEHITNMAEFRIFSIYVKLNLSFNHAKVLYIFIVIPFALYFNIFQ